jgi:hypothetical protein
VIFTDLPAARRNWRLVVEPGMAWESAEGQALELGWRRDNRIDLTDEDPVSPEPRAHSATTDSLRRISIRVAPTVALDRGGQRHVALGARLIF